MQLIKTKSFTLATYSKGDTDAKKLALVLPGKLDTKDYAHMRSHVDFLASLGFFALSFDPPGTWESPGDISLFTTANYIKSVDEIIEYYGNKPTFIAGHSLGGSIAIISGTRNKQAFSYAAIMSTFKRNDFNEKKYKKWKEDGFSLSVRALPPGDGPKVKQFELPYGSLDENTLFSLSEDIKISNIPKLFILGTEDVHTSEDRIIDTFNALSNPKALSKIKGAGHDYRKHPELIEKVNFVIEKFLSEYTKE